MLPPSVRRVVSTTPQSPILSNLASAVPRATTALGLPYKPRHQRRCSSSKPSSPDNGPKDIPAGQSVPASASQSKSGESSDSKSSPSEKRKRKAKNASDRQKLPSVPSTQHLPQESLALSTFFSLHRPISITTSLPKVVSDDSFASIFVPRTQGQRSSDVISTLSRTVDELEQPMAGLSLGHDAHAADDVHKFDVKHLDGSETSVYVELKAMSGQFLPFRPPPLPQPEAARSEAAETGAEEGLREEDAAPHHRVYKAVFTIEETTDADGQVKIMAHSPRLIEEEQRQPRTFLERMALRQLRFEEGRERHGGEGMMAISVKRQRKLKMKKKKYKKLMRRTRNLRRKLDRT
ncbi:hypothetical protein NKR23_g11044 [Pleurostoma richardsiae]|uniref:Small ribosomal subunit protein mS38 n=1 Tax=Pleurostoma richardsiae TaxID=41990 RepID=A0AA38R3J4_9PEZI|nr:hypothetical protein NKR23_g11044 [Pleurostoma richardsiae]